MMKKAFVILFLITVGFLYPGAAGATVFEIGSGGSLFLNGMRYFENVNIAGSHTSGMNDDRLSKGIYFFDETINSFSVGFGDIEVDIQYMSPVAINLIDEGRYVGISDQRLQAGSFNWRPAVTLPHGNDGSLLLDLYNLGGKYFENSTHLAEPIAHLKRPMEITDASAPIPEPATMLLVGVGLIGLAGFGKRKLGVGEKQATYQTAKKKDPQKRTCEFNKIDLRTVN